MQTNSTKESENGKKENQNCLDVLMKKIHLRNSQFLESNNFDNCSNLTQLDINENCIEILDLSDLEKLEIVQCSNNKLRKLILNGKMLKSLIARNNDLINISTIHHPKYLQHLDLSLNQIEEIPSWICDCNNLLTLSISHNNLNEMPDNFLLSKKPYLHTLHLEFNKLQSFPTIYKSLIELQQLFLHCNRIERLPENLFHSCPLLKILNVSGNKLSTLPIPSNKYNTIFEKFYATNNNLTDQIFDAIVYMEKLKVLHLAYNKLKTLPEMCSVYWPELQELILSGNQLDYLPENISNMNSLKVLSAHSNHLQSIPILKRLLSLRTLDISYNHLNKINLNIMISKYLRFLDLSGNSKLQVDRNQLEMYHSQRRINLVDVSGKNRLNIPFTSTSSSYEEIEERSVSEMNRSITSNISYEKNIPIEPPWEVGFSETSGNLSQLYIMQYRQPGYKTNEGFFGLFDVGLDKGNAKNCIKTIPSFISEKLNTMRTDGNAIKEILQKILEKYSTVSSILCHIAPLEDLHPAQFHSKDKQYFVLRISYVGEMSAVLLRQNTIYQIPRDLPKENSLNDIKYSFSLLDPETHQILLNDTDEYLIMANNKIWNVMDPEYIKQQIKMEYDVTLAAKRLQNIAQSFGADENLSIIIIKFVKLNRVDFLMQELQQTISRRSKLNQDCYCRLYRHATELQFIKQLYEHEQSVSEDNYRNCVKCGTSLKAQDPNKQDPQNGTDESDSAISEEQFKSWEYMLEHNSKLLFNKELDTLSKAFNPNRNKRLNTNLSVSTPQLSSTNNNESLSDSEFLNANRSFRNMQSSQSTIIFKSQRLSCKQMNNAKCGPNAAYFGSLHRHKSFSKQAQDEFAPITTKDSHFVGGDSIDCENRMLQYWGFDSTEL